MNSVSINTNHDRSTSDTVQGHKAHEDFSVLRATLLDFGNLTFFFFVTFFQTGNESSVDRLMKQISSFMSEISDEFKIVVVDAIRSVDTMHNN